MRAEALLVAASCLPLLISCQSATNTESAAMTPAEPAAATDAGRSDVAQCRVVGDKRFVAGRETVRLARGEGLPASANFAMFVAPLAVNTDGAPTSYHPRDFLGTSLAINRIDNGIAIRKSGGATVSEKIAAFQQWRDSDWTVPSGYSINWRNVIAEGPSGQPCVFRSGPDKGYFGSLTALKNGLSGAAAGECQVANQLDQRFIPAIVLRGNDNPLRDFGARTGDLVVAINPSSGTVVPAIIGDTGDGDRIGEGSVALNMALLGRTQQPKTYADALGLDTGRADMVVAVLPGTLGFERVRPYSAANIAERVDGWAKTQGYSSTAGLARAVQACGGDL
ncbi:MAG: hypothetical protein H6Q99_2619 [Proteobacteria bacterium]|nr:hypothetical protein [Pseudomonadota bacterium]